MHSEVVSGWPDHFPNGCPDARVMAGKHGFYRLVDSSPPTETDFASHVELELRGTPRRKTITDEHRCVACGVSLFSDLSEIKKLRKSVGPMRKKLIASGNLTDEVVALTGKGSHHTWWRRTDDISWQAFSVLP
ncbi:MAG: hypothetical protein M0Z92_14495 [Actinomycetota bacterium]|nr:hypothetical protein [Actinomycetota bacterium]